MPDLLVRLYDLPDPDLIFAKLQERDIVIRRAMVPDRYRILEFVNSISTPEAAGEAAVALTRQPVAVFLATRGSEILGYACYHATAIDFFGPMAVKEAYRGLGLGKALLLAALHAMAFEGFAYAIIGSAGPIDFYQKTVDAQVINQSDPGFYKDFLKHLGS